VGWWPVVVVVDAAGVAPLAPLAPAPAAADTCDDGELPGRGDVLAVGVGPLLELPGAVVVPELLGPELILRRDTAGSGVVECVRGGRTRGARWMMVVDGLHQA
jgi:hypothetical protein